MTIQQHNPPHPGEFIKAVYLEPFGFSANAVSKKLLVHASTFGRIISGKSDISPEMALRLEAVLGRSAESWMAMQDNYDLAQTRLKLTVDSLELMSFA